MPPGWTVTAPMLSEVRESTDQTLRLSVSGVKVTLEELAAAFVDFQTPPPSVPR